MGIDEVLGSDKNKKIPAVPKPKKIKYKVKSKSPTIYIFSIFTPIVCIGILLLMILYKTSVLWIFIYVIITFPLFIGSSVVFWIKLFLDRKKIKSAIIKKVAKNYIIANFFLDNKRIHREVFLINEDGITISNGEEEYVLDREVVYFDESNRPNSFYKKGIPNPLKFDFSKYINLFSENMSKTKPESTDDFEKETIDISYSSINLKKLKQDKIFSELHRKESDIDIGQVVVILVGLIALVLLLVLVFRK